MDQMTYLVIVEDVVDSYCDKTTLVLAFSVVKVDIWRTVDLIDPVTSKVRCHKFSFTDFVAVDLVLTDDLWQAQLFWLAIFSCAQGRLLSVVSLERFFVQNSNIGSSDWILAKKGVHFPIWINGFDLLIIIVLVDAFWADQDSVWALVDQISQLFLLLLRLLDLEEEEGLGFVGIVDWNLRAEGQ